MILIDGDIKCEESFVKGVHSAILQPQKHPLSECLAEKERLEINFEKKMPGSPSTVASPILLKGSAVVEG